MKIHHIGIAVQSLEREQFWNQFLNLETEEYKEIPDQKVKIAFIPVGEVKIELLEPLGEGAVSKFLEKRGEGIHHIAVQVDDIEGVLTRMKNAGVRLIDETPRQGAEGLIAFIHPKSTGGILLELVQP
ncbi:MAG: methylmalonyl-CoA epimerase [Theionarchaea archaeon]|nr:MAG: methylmalonyl-CoA epimerase [Theionarchaea archaeon DG-70-1]MBU7027795.1 methylmalonyl-CoA epimerase [Theionarchaea archaeon]